MVLPESNSMGLAFINGKSLDDAISLAGKEEIDTLVILENEFYRRATEESVDHLFEKCHQIEIVSTNSRIKPPDMLICNTRSNIC